MRAVIQRVTFASVLINNIETRSIKNGLMILLGITHLDNEEDVLWLCQKIINMRIFADQDDKMNLSIADIDGEILLISQFTLHANTKKGNRPSFIEAAKPEIAKPLYEKTIDQLENLLNKSITTGDFGANMQVSICNDGPITIILDSKNKN